MYVFIDKEDTPAIMKPDVSSLFVRKEIFMAIERRKDNKNRVLKEGEYQRSNGTFEYKWRDKRGKRHSIYAKMFLLA